MAIVELKHDALCEECGALLRKGTRVKAYRKSNGEVIYYGFNCHRRTPTAKPSPSPAQPKQLPVDLTDLLQTIAATLKEIRDHLLQSPQSPSAPTDDSEPQDALTQKDWARLFAIAKKLGFNREQLHDIFQCKSLKDVIKNKADLESAIQMLKELAAF